MRPNTMYKLFAITFLVLNFFSRCTFSQQEKAINWQYPQKIATIDEYFNKSDNETVVFYKHSSKCGLCHMIRDDFNRQWNSSQENVVLVFIEVNENRSLSNYLAKRTAIRHHSPQVIVVKNNEVIYAETHGNIKIPAIEHALKSH